MTRKDRRTGKFTAERTTERERVTERLTVELADDTLTSLPPLIDTTAPGWLPDRTPTSGPGLRAQRNGQVLRAVEFLALWAVSAPPGAPQPERLVPDAVIILRAGPHATPLELTMGRSI